MGHAQLLRDEGMQQGEVTLLLHQMEQKFGPISVMIQQKLEQANTEELLSN